MAYQSNVEALWARNQALERELANARAALGQDSSSSKELSRLRTLGRQKRNARAAKKRRLADEAEAHQRLIHCRDEKSRQRKQQLLADRAMSRCGWLASPMLLAIGLPMAMSLPLFLIVLFILGVLPWWLVAVPPAGVAVLFIIGRLLVRRARRRSAIWLSSHPFRVNGWHRAMTESLHNKPVAVLQFKAKAPSAELVSDLLCASAAQGSADLETMIFASADEVSSDGASLRIPVATWAASSSSRQRDFYRWSKAVVDDVLTELDREFPVARVHFVADE